MERRAFSRQEAGQPCGGHLRFGSGGDAQWAAGGEGLEVGLGRGECRLILEFTESLLSNKGWGLRELLRQFSAWFCEHFLSLSCSLHPWLMGFVCEADHLGSHLSASCPPISLVFLPHIYPNLPLKVLSLLHFQYFGSIKIEGELLSSNKLCIKDVASEYFIPFLYNCTFRLFSRLRKVILY